MSRIVLTCRINGEEATALADPRDTLLEFLRDRLGLTGTKEGCGNGNCGSCTVLLDGEPVNACLMLACEAPGCEITTVEGLAPQGKLSDLQENLAANGAAQCGFCTPGIVMSATALLAEIHDPSEAEIRRAIAGNLCRCTGYDKIVRAIAATARARAGMKA
jgi:aerobic carbon-monoxide dehydrogenase small subunit